MKQRTIGVVALVAAVVTAIWAALFVIYEISGASAGSLPERVRGIESRLDLFIAAYLSAAAVTVAAVAALVGFASFTGKRYRSWSTVAAAILPIYGSINLVVYLSQVFMVPAVIGQFYQPALSATATRVLQITVHGWPGTASAFVNGLAYALLGISSIILGILMTRMSRMLLAGGILMAISGLMCLLAMAGIVIGNAVLMFLSPLGGFVFLLALLLLGSRFLRGVDAPPMEQRPPAVAAT